jgi:hypothetical protein
MKGRWPEARAQHATVRMARQPGRCDAASLFKKFGLCIDLHSPCMDLHSGKADHRIRS